MNVSVPPIAPMEVRDWYDTPLYYDIIFDVDTGLEADFLEAMWRLHAGGSSGKCGSVLEPACGSGRLISEMARRGWITAGFDANTHAIRFARDRLKKQKLHRNAHLWEDRMESFRLPPELGTPPRQFDLAHCLVSSFKYLSSERAAEAHLRLMASALRPGGIYVLGIHLTDYADPRLTHERWVAERNGVHVVCNTRTWPANRRTREERMRSRLLVTFPGTDRAAVRQETHWTFRTYSARQARKLFRMVTEWKIVACHDFHHDPDRVRAFDDSYADIVFILQRR